MHTQIVSISDLDQKIHFDEKKVSNFHFLTKFLKGYFKTRFEKLILYVWKLFFSEFSKFFYWSYEESEIISDFESGSENTISFWIFGFGSRKTKIAQNFAPQWIVLAKFCRGSKIHSTFLSGPQFRDIWNSRNFFVSFRQNVIRSCFWINF